MIQGIKKSLVLKTTILFLIAAILPYLLVSFFFFTSSRNALYEEIVDGTRTKVGLLRNTIDTRVFLLRENAKAFSDLEVMNDTIVDDLDKRITHALERLKKNYDLSGDIYTVNRKGEIIASSDSSSIGRRLETPWLPRVLSGEIVDLDSHNSEINGNFAISFAVPIHSPLNEAITLGALILESRMEGFERMSVDGVMSFAAILDRNGKVTVARADSPFRKRDFLKLPSTNEDTILSRSGYIVSLARSKGIYNFKGFGWTIAMAVDQQKALSPIKKVERASLGVALLGITLIMGLVYFFAAKTIRPLKELHQAAEFMAMTKDLSFRVNPTTHDEVGSLALAFNNMAEEVNRHILMLLESNIEMLQVLGSAIAKRDSETSAHNYRVTIIAISLAETVGINKDGIRSLIKGAFLHDIGKIGISDNILLKQGKLTEKEELEMKTHVRHGTDIISREKWLNNAIDVVRYHHEKFDGSGYPEGLMGKKIPINARVFIIADIFDALTSKRPYKEALSFEKTMQILEEGRGEFFDLNLLDTFKGIALRVYSDICSADEKTLEEALNRLIRKYFF